MIWDSFLTFFLVFLNGFFVAAEFAIVKVRASQITLKEQAGHPTAKVASHLLNHLDAYLSATQLGITIASLGLGWVGDKLFTGIILNIVTWTGANLTNEQAHSLAFPIAFFILTVLHIVFGELAPKSLAIQRPESTTLAIAIPLRIFYFVFQPFIWMLNGLANLILKLVGITPVHGHDIHSKEELKLLVQQGMGADAETEKDVEIIRNAFHFSDKKAGHVMVGRDKVFSLNADQPAADIASQVLEQRYSRIPVYRGARDQITGILYITDLLEAMYKNPGIALAVQDLARPTFFVPETAPVVSLLQDMQRKRVHMAVVVNEYGAMEGILTLEDIIEELVGEIQDELDDELPGYYNDKEGCYVVPGNISLVDLNRFLKPELPLPAGVHSLAGLILKIADRIPSSGESFEAEGYWMQVVKSTPQKIISVKLKAVGDK